MNKKEKTVLLIALALLGLWLFFTYLQPLMGRQGGELGLELVVTYADGSVMKVNPFTSPLKPLTVTDTSGKPISRVDFYAQMRVTWTGEKTGQTLTGVATWSINGVQKGSKQVTTPSTLENGVLATIVYGEIPVSTLESGGSATQTNRLVVTVDVDLKLMFADGGSSTRTGHGEAYLDYKITASGITGLQITVSIAPVQSGGGGGVLG